MNQLLTTANLASSLWNNSVLTTRSGDHGDGIVAVVTLLSGDYFKLCNSAAGIVPAL